jgi:hypothetical protein
MATSKAAIKRVLETVQPKGTVAKALSSLTAVSVEVRQDKNAANMAADVAGHGDALQMVAVSRIAFGK